jgi:hypothetical protein
MGEEVAIEVAVEVYNRSSQIDVGRKMIRSMIEKEMIRLL